MGKVKVLKLNVDFLKRKASGLPGGSAFFPKVHRNDPFNQGKR
jgi:hypothetical protein